MKIVTFKEFIDLPDGTLFRLFTPICFEGTLSIKGESINEHGYYFTSMSEVQREAGDSDSVFLKMIDTKQSFPLEIEYERQGLYVTIPESQMFAIYEKEDVNKIILLLQESLNQAY